MTAPTPHPYPAYKPTGVPWLGDVPEHWEVEKVKKLACSNPKSFVDGDWIESPYITSDGIRLIQTGNIGIGEYREQGFRYVSEATFQNFKCTEIQPGNILICRLGEPVARACLAPQLGKRMITSVDVCILKPREDVNAKFVVYCMSSHRYLGYVGSLVRGSTRNRVSRSMLAAFQIPLPPLPEQRTMVRYLDHVDRRIRRYVAAKEKLVGLLEEERQAVVNRAVTRGLDPNVRLKPSGVEWLGDVPEHWELRRLASVSRPKSVVNQRHRELLSVYLNIGVVRFSEMDERRTNPTSQDLSNYQAVDPGDLVLNNQQAWRGSVGVANLKGIVSPAYLVLSLSSRLDSIFANLLFRDRLMVGQYVTCSKGVGTIQRNLYWPYLKQVITLLPPLPEQQAIVEYLDKATANIDEAIARARRQIELLQEYRTRLIADVVTGKLDVRAAAAAGLPKDKMTESG